MKNNIVQQSYHEQMISKKPLKFNPLPSQSSIQALILPSDIKIQLKIHSHNVSEEKQDPSKLKIFKQWECIGNLHNPKGCSSSVSGEGKINNPSVKKYICDANCPNVQLCSQCVIELRDAAVLPTQIDHPLHPKHPLTRSFNLNQQWACNGKDYLGCVFKVPVMTGVKDIERYTCVECDYDLCIRCVYYYLENPQIMTLYQVTSSLHQHPMTRWFDDNAWYCNGQKNGVDCTGGMVEYQVNSKINRWRCESCDFDLCEECIKDSMTDACPFYHPPDRESFQTVKL